MVRMQVFVGCEYWENALRIGAEWVDRDVVRAAVKHSRPGGTAVDGGAHVGSWVPRLASVFGTVHAFEPVEDNFALLRANTSSVANVVLWQVALGAKSGYAHMAKVPVAGANSGQWAVSPAGTKVEVVTLDSIGVMDLSMLKLDLEGFELFALRGAVRTLRRCRPVVVIEEAGWGKLHGVPDGAASAFLVGLGYRPIFVGGQDFVFVHPEGTAPCG